MIDRMKLPLVGAVVVGALLLVANLAGAEVSGSQAAVAAPQMAMSVSATPQPSPSAIPDCQLAWQWVDTPNHTPEPGGLGGASAISANDVWAITGFFGGQIAAEHWDGSSWQFVEMQNPGQSNSLGATAALASNNVWAVGSQTDNHTTLIEHWDGQAWSIVPSPNPNPGSELNGVTAVSADDIWAVGDTTIITGGIGVLQTLIEHWNGITWNVVPSANVNPPGDYSPNFLREVSAVSADDVWAVGVYADSTTGVDRSLLEHWDGNSWQVAAAPFIGEADVLYSVAARSSSDVWAVGSYNMGNSIGLLALHWDGSNWQAADVPYPGTDTNGLRGVVTLAADNVWAVGDYFTNGMPNHTLVEHWDGSSWRLVPSPSDAYEDTLLATAAVSNTDIWAVGRRTYSPPPDTIALHYSVPDSCLSPTPTTIATASATPTFTPAPSPMNSPTASATPTLTLPPSATETATASATPTLTPAPSATVLPSPAASATPCGQSYADVTPEYWAYGYIHYLSCRSIVSGYPDGLFHPSNPISRAEFSKMLALGYGLPLLTPAQPSFADVTPSYWAYSYIESLHAAGAISGYADGSFHPNASISRAEMVKMNVLASGVSAYTGALADYPDVPPSYWAYGYIKTATYKQWVGGYSDGLFHPASNASRAELSKVLYLSLSYPRR